MKKADIIRLIRSHYDGDAPAFRHQCIAIAREFDAEGDEDLADFIMSLLSDSNSFVPQSLGGASEFLIPMQAKDLEGEFQIHLPKTLNENISNIIRVINRPLGVNKFLFVGEPGTGKTETVKKIARESHKELFYVDMTQVVDSYLGQTSKNIDQIFKEINQSKHPERMMLLFDEVDAIALARIDSNDVREMGRATTAMLHGLDYLNDKVVLFATTNLFQAIDKALTRRFDYILSFDSYDRDDLIQVAMTILDQCANKYQFISRDKRIFRKILSLFTTIPNPGDLKNLVKTSVAFSDEANEHDYLRRLYRSATGRDPDVIQLKNEGFTLREIEHLTSIPKSTVGRRITGSSAKQSISEVRK